MATASPPSERFFSINSGGPFRALVERLHLLRPSGMVRVWWIVLFAWLPLMLGALLRAAFGVRPDPIVLDISVHVRFLVGLPLLLWAAQLIELQCDQAVRQLYQDKLADRTPLDRVLDRAKHLRDAGWIEAVLAICVLVFGQLVLWGVVGPTGLVHGVSHAIWSFSRIWYASVGLPLVLFFMLRWIWRWLVWTYILVRVSRLPLAANAAHPDGAAGLAFLSWPIAGFAAFVLAVSSVLAGAWATQLLDGRTTIPSLVPTAVAYAVLAIALALGPLLLFSRHVYRAKWQGLAVHTPMAYDYVRQFHEKWLSGKRTEHLLGTQDIQALADLGNAFQVVVTTRLFVFRLDHLKQLVLAVLIPLLPLVATTVPLPKLFTRLVSSLIGVGA